MTKQLQFPHISVNGTDGFSLGKQYMDAMEAVLKAKDAVRHIEVHARDYQTLGDDAFRKAVAEHVARVQALRDVADELLAIAENIMLQTG